MALAEQRTLLRRNAEEDEKGASEQITRSNRLKCDYTNDTKLPTPEQLSIRLRDHLRNAVSAEGIIDPFTACPHRITLSTLNALPLRSRQV